MKSIDERLAESNPVAQGYVPASYELMVARAMRQPRHVDSAWKAFRVRMAGSVAAASALTVLGVSLLGGAGSALPVLGFYAAASSHAPGATKYLGQDIAGPLLPVMRNYTFTGAGSFSTSVGTAPTYDISAPTDVRSTLETIARALGATIATTTASGNSGNGSLTLSGADYSGSIIRSGGVDTWNIYATPKGVAGAPGASGIVAPSTSGASGESGASGVTGSPATLSARALDYVHALGQYTPGVATQNVGTGQTTIDVGLLIDGYPSDLTDSFTFSSSGALRNATGETFSLGTATTYPIISEAAGVEQINAQKFYRYSGWVGYAPLTANSVGSSSSTATGQTSHVQRTPRTVNLTTTLTSATGTTTTTSVTGATGATSATTAVIAQNVVNLTSVSMKFSSYEMSGGVWMELPVYNYTGTVVNGGYHITFDVVPLPSQYLNFAVNQNRVPLGAR